MTLSLPYSRISRPFVNPHGSHIGTTIDKCYLVSPAYAENRVGSIRAYSLLENDLQRVFEYVEPSDFNKTSYSMRSYELLLRAATEFESNCKAVLGSNGYNVSKNLNVQDYFKLENAMHLSAYEMELSIWGPQTLKIRPFKDWSNGHSLRWYRAYNKVKHNRSAEFHVANLETLIEAIAAVFLLLYAQFNILVFRAHELVSWHNHSDDGWISHEGSIFRIKPPAQTVWVAQDCYEFDQENWLANPETKNYPFP